ncbi:MAG: response regulator [Lachnospiraceae bacterium]|nr:response regulator [Lachnospiraceae bacterium]
MDEMQAQLLPDYRKWQKAYRNFTYVLVGIILAFQVVIFFIRKNMNLITNEQEYLARQILGASLIYVILLIIETVTLYLGRNKEDVLNLTPVMITLLIFAVNSATSSKSIIVDGFLTIPIVMSVIYCNKKLARITFISTLITMLAVFSMHYLVRPGWEHQAMLLDVVLGSVLLITAYVVVRIIINLIQEQNKKVLRANQQVQDAEARAAISDNAKTAFLANISHEIRTPMNAIVGMTELLLSKKHNKENLENYAQNIKTSGESLLSIVSDMLDYSKMQTGDIALIEQEYAVDQLIDSLSQIAWNRIGEKNVELLFDIDTNLPKTLFGDVNRIKQVLSNLLINGIKYTDSGYIKLTMRMDSLEGQRANLYMSVEDTGRGMKEEELEKAFSSFEQISVKKNKKQEGMGIGLPISREIVQMMGGELKARSKEGVGSTFYFSITQSVVERREENIELPAELIIGGHTKHNCVTLEMLSQAKQLGIMWRDAEPDESTDYYFTDDEKYLKSADATAEIEIDEVKFVYLYNPLEEIPDGLPEEILVLEKPVYASKLAAVLTGKAGQRVQKVGVVDGALDFVAPEARLLLVDDNEMNLTVADALLKPTKMKIDHAENGKRAVEMIKENHYDFVFMDHMMPIMDGVEATRTIRAMDGAYYKDLPIVAFTANVLTEAAIEFKEAGMNDFVTKPVQFPALCEKIKKYMNPALIRPATEEDFAEEEEAAAPAGQQLSIENLAGIDTKAGLEACGSEALFRKLLGDYCRIIDMKATKLEKCLADGMIRDYTIEVHALKNTSRMIGATELSGWFKQMEDYGNAENVEAIAAENADLLDTYRSYKRVLEPFMDASEEDKVEADVEELIADLKNMDHAMDTFDLDTVASIMKKIQGLRVPACVKDKERMLEAYVADVAMEEVMQITKEMVAVLEMLNKEK